MKVLIPIFTFLNESLETFQFVPIFWQTLLGILQQVVLEQLCIEYNQNVVGGEILEMKWPQTKQF